MTRKTRQDGIRTPADLKLRCVVDPDTACWHWKAARDVNNRPSFWFPPIKAVASIGVACAWWKTGKRPEKGSAWHAVCNTPDCANPAHRRCGDRSTQMLALKIVRSPLVRARQAQGKRLHSKLTDADVAAIRGSTMTLQQIMDRYGICRSYACQLRRGVKRATLVAPQSSVFAIGAAMNSLNLKVAA